MGCGASAPPKQGEVWRQQPVQQVVVAPPPPQQVAPAPPSQAPLFPPQQPIMAAPSPMATPRKTTTASVNQAVLERYLALEKEIAQAEKESPKMVLDHKQTQITQLTTKIIEQEIQLDKLSEETKNDQNILNEILSEVKEGDVIDETIRESMAQMNSKEIAAKELNNLKGQKQNLENEIVTLKARSEELHALYDEQEGLLNEIFGGSYGSDEENRLEHALDQHEQMRHRIVEANFKWRQAQLMVDYAYKQLEHAVRKWLEIPGVNPSNLEGRYAIAAETRNNLVASAQNIQGAQRYLSNVQFPYCAPSEVDTLNKATAYIFTDMQTVDRHAHALECYSITSKRCGALLQWLNQVVTQTISKDLDDINAKVKASAMGLRRERVRLIKDKVKEVLGKDVDIAVTEVNTDVEVNLNLNDLALTDGINPNEFGLTAEELKALELLTQEELAPPPSNKEVFGEQAEALKEGFQQDQSRVQHQIEENRGKVVQSLEEKLAARRQRRARKKIEDMEKQAYANANGNTNGGGDAASAKSDDSDDE